MACTPLSNDGKTIIGYICWTPQYYTFWGKRRTQVNFSYGPYYGVEVLDDKGKRRRGTKAEWAAIVDWLHRNTYRRGNKESGRDIIGYVKPKWKP
jgi:hypothetical protein